MSEKTEQPTSKRLRDARQRGQVVKSQEINATVQLGLILLWLMVEGPSLQAALGGSLDTAILVCTQPLGDALAQLTNQLAAIIIRFVFGLAGLLVVSLTLTSMLQVGFLVAPEALQPSADRINPLNNLKQMVSLHSLFELAKMVLKVSVLGLTFAYLINRYAPSFSHLPQAGLTAGFAVCVQLAQWMWAVLLIATAVFAVADYGMQYYQLRRQLMMSHEDIKQEYKDSEGNPEIKQRRRELQREVQSGSLAGKVSGASVVVRNPTHIAVCLSYVPDETPLPVVLDYGRDARALQIVALAEKFGIPVVENVPLARALIASTEPGDYVPEPLFEAVAQVLRLIQEQMEADDANL
ncbi:EscU/YscU/HrcU family type III secretion system export apparatus switch protein [Chitinimonas sp. BJB300]|uniref:EscU/YscU/HrcU family type III secretion system export apparatus switch protein n=1 Tax=Chitinimonas sp. BJB300 TaxID=1559339 RepID=UPI000C120F23|nr:EscU/YscU/HrcU family type III secretion system export apparatus switch protein [Chitinimonas sp. BJB300]PHV11487.1 EscU/YscU/HrcU family type III secretion system export apparatus switch protein [Chitinimonas sp. BJB300]TSJ88517.1 EscU/YscU/HrcU family type III secretion system export apparatus switch protein [Chitinimonas sp. BJB300]